MGEDNPDVCVVPLENEAIKQGVEQLARAVRADCIDGKRLQRYHAQRYSYDAIASRWVNAILYPREFWNHTGASRRL
jgi:hypothetical protein